jgi:hypothetical protein
VDDSIGFNGGRSSVGRAPDCGSGRRGFESHRPPQSLGCVLKGFLIPCHHCRIGPLAQLVEQLTLNQLVVGSSPTRPTIFKVKFLLPEFDDQPLAVVKRAVTWLLFVKTGCPVYFPISSGYYEALGSLALASCLLARVAELVDALDLGSSGVTRESSSLSFRTIQRFSAG